MPHNLESPDSYYSPWEKAFGKILTPFEEFLHKQTTGGIVLMASTIIALIIANGPLAEQYAEILHTHISINVGTWQINHTVHDWVNDGLMALFFFVVGLEIKREVLVGDLKDIRAATLPIVAAIGGMIVPALVYVAINYNGPNIMGWGIPMATDIAFAVGVLALLGNRVPKSLYTFLVALAIVDDLGAVTVIAIFYTEQIIWQELIIAGVIFAGLISLNRVGIRHPLPYFILGIFMWMAFLESGVHATIAGVLAALTVPYRPKLAPVNFAEHLKQLLERFGDRLEDNQSSIINYQRQRAVVHAIELGIQKVQSPLQRLEHGFHPIVAFGIVPIFALVNAGIPISGDSILATFNDKVGLGIILGLILGKILGIAGVSLLTIKLGIAKFPAHCNSRHIIGTGLLAGIGFTMSIFIADLAFKGQEDVLLNAKTGILCASLLAGLGGYMILRFFSHSEDTKEPIEAA